MRSPGAVCQIFMPDNPQIRFFLRYSFAPVMLKHEVMRLATIWLIKSAPRRRASDNWRRGRHPDLAAPVSYMWAHSRRATGRLGANRRQKVIGARA
jgi:hypothetical protein